MVTPYDVVGEIATKGSTIAANTNLITSYSPDQPAERILIQCSFSVAGNLFLVLAGQSNKQIAINDRVPLALDNDYEWSRVVNKNDGLLNFQYSVIAVCYYLTVFRMRA